MLTLAAISFSKLVPFAVFLLFAIGAWLVLEIIGGRKPRAEERLDELRSPGARKRGDDAPVKKSATVTKVLAKATPMAKPLQPKSAEEEGKLKRRLGEAGFRSEGAVSIFLAMKFIGLIVGLTLSGGTSILTGS